MNPVLKYNDLVKHQTLYISRLKENRELSRTQGITYFTVMNRNIECAERILTLLKEKQRDHQTDLFEKNTQLNHK